MTPYVSQDIHNKVRLYNPTLRLPLRNLRPLDARAWPVLKVMLAEMTLSCFIHLWLSCVGQLTL